MKIALYLLPILFALLPSHLAAQELTPRAYWPAPTGTQLATIGYSHTSGDTVPDPSLPITGVDSKIDNIQIGYLQTLNLFGRTSNFTLNMPYSTGDTTAEGDDGTELSADYQGVGDVSATLSINMIGAPAMSREQFALWRMNPELVVSGSLKVVFPTGRYDSDQVINVGANRWAAKAELGIIAPLNPKWVFELDLGNWFFGDNDDFLGVTREQGQIISAQGHLVHRFKPGLWASFDATLYKGGRSKINGVRLDDLQRDAKLGVTLMLPISRTQAVKLGYSQGSINDKNEDFDLYSISYSRLF